MIRQPSATSHLVVLPLLLTPGTTGIQGRPVAPWRPIRAMGGVNPGAIELGSAEVISKIGSSRLWPDIQVEFEVRHRIDPDATIELRVSDAYLTNEWVCGHGGMRPHGFQARSATATLFADHRALLAP